jgi:hypothetical protein
MEVKQTTAEECSPKLYRQLGRLNLRRIGLMQRTFQMLRKNKGFNVIYYAEEEGQILSWSLCFYSGTEDQYSNTLSVYTYTRRWNRGSGVASKVFDSVKQYCKDHNKAIAFYPWNDRSNIYFTKCKKHCTYVKIELRPNACPPGRESWKVYEGL